jgi:hypothetical protein
MLERIVRSEDVSEYSLGRLSHDTGTIGMIGIILSCTFDRSAERTWLQGRLEAT